METNYISKRLKLILPVFALLMLTSFLVNAQDKQDFTLENNAIEVVAPEEALCGVGTVTITGSTLADPAPTAPGGLDDDEFYGFYNEEPCDPIVTPTFTWHKSVDGGTTWEPIAGETGADLVIEISETTRFRRIVAYYCAETGPDNTYNSNVVEVEVVGEPFDCEEDNVITYDGDLVFCSNPDLGTIDILGSEVPEHICDDTGVATTTYQWWITKPGESFPGEQIVGETDKDLLGFDVSGFNDWDEYGDYGFKRQIVFDPEDDRDLCVSNVVTITFHPEMPEAILSGPTPICTDEFPRSTVYNVVTTDWDGYPNLGQLQFIFGASSNGSMESGDVPTQITVKWESGNLDGFVSVIVRDPDTGCEVSGRIDVPSYLQVADAGDDVEVCGREVTLDADAGQTGEWTYVEDPNIYVGFDDPTKPDAVATITPTADAADYKVTFVWEVTTAPEWCVDTDEVTITFEDHPHISEVTNDGPACICVCDERYSEVLQKKDVKDFCTSTIRVTIHTDTPLIGGTPSATKDGDDVVFGDVFDVVGSGETDSTRWYDLFLKDPADYGTYVFTYTMENECGTATGSTTLVFDLPVYVDVMEDFEVCDSFSSSGKHAITTLTATVTIPDVENDPCEDEIAAPANYFSGVWTTKAKPAGANEPTFADPTNPVSDVMVSSFGTYTFVYTAHSANSAGEDYMACTDSDYVVVTFYPGLESAEIATTPVDEVCSLAFGIRVDGTFDYAQLSGKSSTDHYLEGEVSVYRRVLDGTDLIWEAYPYFTTESSTGNNQVAWPKVDNKLTVKGPNKTALGAGIWLRMDHYGEFKVELDLAVTDGDGNKISDEPCEGDDYDTIKLYWQPVASVLPNDYDAQYCGTEEVVTLIGSTPRGTFDEVTGRWEKDGPHDNWNSSVAWWEIWMLDDNEEWVEATDEFINVVETSANGREIQFYAKKQVQIRAVYSIENKASAKGCFDYDYQDIDFLEAPYAGVGTEDEICGVLSYGFDWEGKEELAENCTGWDGKTWYRYPLDAEPATENTLGNWSFEGPGNVVFVEPAPGYDVADVLPWDLDSWVAAPNNPNAIAVLANIVDGELVICTPGTYTLTWTVENPLWEGSEEECVDAVDHVVTFNKTPEARGIVPIAVVDDNGVLKLDEDYVQPFIDCYTCDDNVQYYMLTLPYDVDVTHPEVDANGFFTVQGGRKSTVPMGQSVLWHTIAGAQEGAVVNKSIPGGMILKTYGLASDGETLITTGDLHHHKHHIVAIEWEGEPNPGVIKVEEWNSSTLCDVVHEFEINRVDPVYIALEFEGHNVVDAYRSADEDDNPYLYKINHHVPGASYHWEVEGGEIQGGWLYGEFDIEDLEEGFIAYEDFDEYHEALYIIHVLWGDAGEGLVSVEIEGYCFEQGIDDMPITIRGNTIAGQVKYWNQDETRIPSPFQFYDHGPDYFYVRLYEVMEDYDKAGHLVYEPVATKRVMAHPTDANLPSYFEFENIDLNKEYALKIWDGGFSLTEGDKPATNQVVHTYSWKGYPGVNALDALTMVRMWREEDVSDYWWIGDGLEDDDYGFLSNSLADVTVSGELTFNDIRALLYRSVGTYAQFQDMQGNHVVPNFRVAGRFVEELPMKTFGDGTEVTGFCADEDVVFTWNKVGVQTFSQLNNPESYHYLSDVFSPVGNETNINVYYVGTGDLHSRNTTVVGGGVTKSTDAKLAYEGVINAQVGDVVTIPVRMSSSADIAGFNLGLTFDNTAIEVLEVDHEIVNISNEEGFVRIATVDTYDHFYGAGDAIANITVKVRKELEMAELFALEASTTFGNLDLDEIAAELNTDKVSTGDATGIEDVSATTLSVNNYPNPFRTTTTIDYTLPESGKVTLAVYNRVGQRVTTVVDETQEAGRYSVKLSSEDLGGGDGMFIYRITVEGQTRTFNANGNLILMK